MNGDPDKPKPPPGGVPLEDASSQALAEALRSSFGLIKLVMIGLVFLFLGSGFFSVRPQERAIVLRFGRPVGEPGKQLLPPGPHWAFPYPIDEVKRVPFAEVQQVDSTTGWYATRRDEALNQVPPAMNLLRPGVEGYALTADQNIVHTRATLFYKINDPIRFLFDYAGATNAVQDVLDDALLCTAARFKVDDILTREKEAFQEAVRKRVAELLEARQVGVVVDQCNVESKAPRWLKSAFDSVTTAEETRGKVLSEAERDANQVLSKASADAASRLNAAESERARLVKAAQSDAERFKALLPKYRENPDLFVQQRLIESIAKVLPNVEKWVEPGLGGASRELRLLLNREPQKAKTEGTP